LLTITCKAQKWKAVTAGLVPIIEEAVLHVKKEGIECAALDPSHTEGIGFFWEERDFDKYELTSEGQLDLQINIAYFTKVVRRFADDSMITITTKHVDTEEIKDKVVGFTVTDGVKKFDCALYLGTPGTDPLPNIPYVDKFEMELSKMEEMMDDCKVFGIDVCQFKEDEGKLVYYATEAAGNLKGVMVEKFDMQLSEIGFNFTFMEPVLKSLKPYIGKNIFVEVFERAPIRLSFDIPDACTIKYYLAPTVR